MHNMNRNNGDFFIICFSYVFFTPCLFCEATLSYFVSILSLLLCHLKYERVYLHNVADTCRLTDKCRGRTGKGGHLTFPWYLHYEEYSSHLKPMTVLCRIHAM